MSVVERENAKKNLVDKSSASRATDDTMNMNEKKNSPSVVRINVGGFFKLTTGAKGKEDKTKQQKKNENVCPLT